LLASLLTILKALATMVQRSQGENPILTLCIFHNFTNLSLKEENTNSITEQRWHRAAKVKKTHNLNIMANHPVQGPKCIEIVYASLTKLYLMNHPILCLIQKKKQHTQYAFSKNLHHSLNCKTTNLTKLIIERNYLDQVY